MKTLFLAAGMLMVSLGAMSQSVIDKLFDKYSDTEGYTSVYISKYMFDMFRNKDTDVKTQEDLSQVMSKLNCIKIIATDDDPSTPAPVNLYQEVMKVLPPATYKEIMVIKDKGQNVKFYAREVNGRVAELLMLVGGADENVLISIQGDIDMKNISKLAESMNIEGMENLEKMKK